ncbi:retrovirus-related pol polyprotein from transposon TNT 1-94 [Tanacetum coccineum]
MLRVFPISLTGAASRWLRNEPTGSIKTWEDLKTKFLNKYCPPGRTAKKMEEINNFQQEPDETLYQAWERFKELLMKCPQHYLTEMQEVILFYNGLDVPTRQILDSRGAVPTKTAADAKTAIQEMAEYSQKWHNGTSRGRSTETSDGLAAIQAQLNNLGREIKKVNEKVYAAQVGLLEDMDVYRDDGMGDVIFGEPFLREIGIKTKRFEGIITLYKCDEGDDLLTRARESNLYTISISDMAASSPVCLMSKATSTKSCKDHLCSACERGKSKKYSHQPNLVPSTHSKLELLHMDLYGPMRVETINGKKLIEVQ